jgi:hypothetical protein
MKLERDLGTSKSSKSRFCFGILYFTICRFDSISPDFPDAANRRFCSYINT